MSLIFGTPHIVRTLMDKRVKVLSVVGARPNFMKIAPIHEELKKSGSFESLIVHTGQHYDDMMSDVFFRDLGISEPDIFLGVGSGSHAVQTGRVMTEFDRVVVETDPELVIVVGDVNSTLACSVTAAKRGVPVAHVESGLRSFDRRMPEEINRVVTDQLSDFLFVTEQSGVDNLRNEGRPEGSIFLVGNVMIDTLIAFREKAKSAELLDTLGLAGEPYVLVTFHRPSNVDDPRALAMVAKTLERIAAECTVVFPVHPRTRKRLLDTGLDSELRGSGDVLLLKPVGYLDFLHLMEHASAVVTDSGGIQEETTFLRVPCLTVRENTERPVTVEFGTNQLVPLEPDEVAARVRRAVSGDVGNGGAPPLWDGRASQRIVSILRQHFEDGARKPRT